MTFPALLQENLPLFLTCVFLFGLAVGSFLNVVIHRLPKMMMTDWQEQCHELLEIEQPETHGETVSLSRPASTCPHCGHLIRAWENIPIISYLLLRGKCSSCQAAISPRYPIIEAVTALLSVVVAWHFGVTWETAAALPLTWALIALSMIDFDHKLLPDSIVLPFLWLGLILSTFGVFTDPQSSIYGAVFGYLSLWSVFHLFKLLTGKEGMGHGDFKLLALFGAWLGWQYLLQIILLSSVVGAIVGILLILFLGRDRNIPIPFGPYIAAAGWISLLWGESINHAYLTWAGLN